ncbi:hypothetical protein Tco_1256515 [Tanacetum coccineum]
MYPLPAMGRIPGQEFDKPLTEEEALSFIRELGHFGEINYITKEGPSKEGPSKKRPTKAKKSKKPKTKSKSAISSKEGPSKKRPTKAKKDVPSKKKPTSKPKPTKKKASVEADKGDGTDFESGVPDEQQHKTSGADEGTGTKPGVPDVPKYLSESKNESWGDSDDDESNDDNSDEVPKDDDEDDVESDANDHNEASDSEKTESDKDENLNLNPNDDEEEEKEEDDIRTPDSFEFNDDDEEYDELYKDVNVRIKHSSTPLLTVPVTAIPKTSTVAATTVPPVIQPFSSILQMTTPTPVPTTEPTTSLIPDLPDFASLFGFNKRVPALEQDLSHVKQVDYSAQILAQIPAIVNEHLSTRIGFATQTTLQSYTAEFEKKAQAKKEKYIDIIEKSVKEIIKDEVKSQLPQILPKEISDFATPVIQSTINESLENVVLAKFSSQSQSTYEAATSLTEFELKKILLDELKKSKLYQAAEQHRDLYNALVKFYQLDKDLFDSYGKSYSLKRGRKDKDKDEDPSAGSD